MAANPRDGITTSGRIMSNLALKDIHVCVIEPSTTQGKIIKQNLKELDIESVTIFEKGMYAIDGLQDQHPDLVISSMYLPDMTGTDIVLSMRDNDELESVPFMLISSETSFSMLEPIRQAGVIAILPKPFVASDLKKALYSTLDYINPDNVDVEEFEIDTLKVLVVDDSPLARKHISRVITNIGIEHIDQAENGRQAIDLINEHFYDLVITDYNMPEVDGEMLTRYVRENSNQSSVPIIMVTSEGNDARLSAIQQSGVSGICDKPFEIGQVRSLIKKVLID